MHEYCEYSPWNFPRNVWNKNNVQHDTLFTREENYSIY